MSEVSRKSDYPEHLNPFDDNYNAATLQPSNSREKYNTWSASRPNQVSTLTRQKPKPTLLERPWAALNISPKGKIGRRLSILKAAVERFASKKKRRSHGEGLQPRSASVHDDFAFKIISPKLKEKIRQQAFSGSLAKQDQTQGDSMDSPSTPEVNGRLSLPLKPDGELEPKAEDCSPASPDSDRETWSNTLGARPKTTPRKKRPPPPPPSTDSPKPNLELRDSREKAEDTQSASSSITHDLEKDAVSEEEEHSQTDFDHQGRKSD